jgi:hypothetical protein
MEIFVIIVSKIVVASGGSGPQKEWRDVPEGTVGHGVFQFY